MTLRMRILLTVMPVVVLLLAIGTAGLWLIQNLGRSADTIIRENYISIQAMHDALHALDKAELGLTTKDTPAFQLGMKLAISAHDRELNNITIPGEREAAEELGVHLRKIVSKDATPEIQLAEIQKAKAVAGRIYLMNEDAMFAADSTTKGVSKRSSWYLGLATVLALLLAFSAILRLVQTIHRPIESVTNAAAAISRGEYQQLLPVQTRDELGRLAETFNAMAGKLRTYRQSDQDTISRTRRAAQATVDAFTDPVLVLSPTNTVEFANPAAQRLFGVSPSQTQPWLPPAELQAILEEARQRQAAVILDRFDQGIVFRNAQGEQLYLPQAHPVATTDGETLGLALVLLDITRFRLLDQLKSDWVATVSHELKTPLTSVQLAVHVLLEENVGTLTPKQTELLLEARTNADRLFHLIEQLLAMAKLEDERYALVLQPTDVVELLNRATADIESPVEDAKLVLVREFAPDVPMLNLDNTQFSFAINNLLQNAITHTPAGGTITVVVSVKDDTVIEIVVKDTGVGIPTKDLPNIFERFFRVEGRESVRGTGLGLAIVREIVEAHNGTITVASTEGTGTTFTINLPQTER